MDNAEVLFGLIVLRFLSPDFELQAMGGPG